MKRNQHTRDELQPSVSHKQTRIRTDQSDDPSHGTGAAIQCFLCVYSLIVVIHGFSCRDGFLFMFVVFSF